MEMMTQIPVQQLPQVIQDLIDEGCSIEKIVKQDGLWAIQYSRG